MLSENEKRPVYGRSFFVAKFFLYRCSSNGAGEYSGGVVN